MTRLEARYAMALWQYSCMSTYLLLPSNIYPFSLLSLYNVLATALALLFLAGLVVGFWRLFTEGWKHIAKKDLRNDMREKIRRWPTSKWDLLPVIMGTYLLTVVLAMVALMLTVPRGYVAGIMSPEDVPNLWTCCYESITIRWSYYVNAVRIC